MARSNGIRIYNAAMIEADGRRVLVQSTDEAEIALGIQRVLRERVITVCFVEGHGELPMDNFEFHTHLEGVADHSHDDASSRLVQMAGHGVGRFRRALEAQGYEARRLILATNRACRMTARWWSWPIRAPPYCPAKATRCAVIWRTAVPRCCCSILGLCSSRGSCGLSKISASAPSNRS